MGSGKSQGHDRDVREKIVSLMESIGDAPTKPLASEELQKLTIAANRLDQILKKNADANQMSLKSAVGKLDQLLADISSGKDIAAALKRNRKRDSSQNRAR